MSRKAIVIGAGPAGLTAAFELLIRTDIVPIVLEKSGEIGGISRTTNFKGNRMDMGPHRFFSKSDRVMEWWLKMMPLGNGDGEDVKISYQNKSREINGKTGVPKDPDKVMLVIQRLTRIYFLRKFFAYPIQLSYGTLKTLGVIRTMRILFSFLWIRLFPRKPETNLEDFIINKFGQELYLLFFKDYTEKVWGVAPGQISAEWGAQRIKGVSLSKAIAGAVKSLRRKKAGDIGQKGTETSLIEQFLYPKYGPGSLWEEVARQIEALGGKIYLHQDVRRIYTKEGKVHSVHTVNSQTGQAGTCEGEYFFSTMPVQELVAGMGDGVPQEVQEVAAGLQYRDFINVGILLKQLSTKEGKTLELKDNWIYIQERDVKVGRLMIYNNWGGGMIKDPDTTWIGMEYFCNKTDELWAEPDEAVQQLAIAELIKMNLARIEDVLDCTVQRMEKTYPAYFGTYGQFEKIRAYTDQFANLFLIGRSGMHKYNNADHSMLCGMVAVDNIVAGVTSKANLWAINTEHEYHEEKQRETASAVQKQAPMEKFPFLAGYLWNNRANRAWWMVGIAVLLIQFIFFKIRYPFANYMPDSYSYLQTAYTNDDVDTWPVAYSKFLRLISVFTHSDKVVVGLQYLFMQSSALLFLLTFFYFQAPGKIVRRTLFIFFIFNPVSLYLANYISSDALFVGLSLLWLTSLVWIIYQPHRWIVWIHAVLLLGCFTVRYNAIYYPLISLAAYIISRQPWKWKVIGMAFGIGLVLLSIIYTSRKMRFETGKWQFSAFSGWQLANNALYMYQHIPAADRVPVPARFAPLDRMVQRHMDTLAEVKFSGADSVNSYFYLWSKKGPLIQYMISQFKRDTVTPYFKKWASEGPLFRDYAMFLIARYPMQFAVNFMLPNAVKLAVPPAEFLGIYNMGEDSVRKLAKDWFNYNTRKVQAHDYMDIGAERPLIEVMTFYSIFSALVNVLLIVGIIGVVSLNAIRWKERGLPQMLGLILLLWLTNGIFSIFASPIVLRYQIFPILVWFSVALVTFDYVHRINVYHAK